MLKENIPKVLSEIKAAAQSCGRDYSAISLVCASKYADAALIKEAFNVGISVFGENKVQDASRKSRELKELDISWHMFGHLQRNKVKVSVELFDLIQSVDSIRLVEEINQKAAAISKRQDILIEVNTTEEPQKYGVDSKEVEELVKACLNLKNISLKGLMTMGKFTSNPENNRIYFKRLKELFDHLNKKLNLNMYILSMGMTDDYKVAIEEGSTMLRIGRAIWG